MGFVNDDETGVEVVAHRNSVAPHGWGSVCARAAGGSVANPQ